jgi:hypothetical protein
VERKLNYVSGKMEVDDRLCQDINRYGDCEHFKRAGWFTRLLRFLGIT